VLGNLQALAAFDKWWPDADAAGRAGRTIVRAKTVSAAVMMKLSRGGALPSSWSAMQRAIEQRGEACDTVLRFSAPHHQCGRFDLKCCRQVPWHFAIDVEEHWAIQYKRFGYYSSTAHYLDRGVPQMLARIDETHRGDEPGFTLAFDDDDVQLAVGRVRHRCDVHAAPKVTAICDDDRRHGPFELLILIHCYSHRREAVAQ